MCHGLERDGVTIQRVLPPFQAVPKCESSLVHAAGNRVAHTACRRRGSVRVEGGFGGKPWHTCRLESRGPRFGTRTMSTIRLQLTTVPSRVESRHSVSACNNQTIATASSRVPRMTARQMPAARSSTPAWSSPNTRIGTVVTPGGAVRMVAAKSPALTARRCEPGGRRPRPIAAARPDTRNRPTMSLHRVPQSRTSRRVGYAVRTS